MNSARDGQKTAAADDETESLCNATSAVLASRKAAGRLHAARPCHGDAECPPTMQHRAPEVSRRENMADAEVEVKRQLSES